MDLRIKDKDFQFRQTDELNLDIEALELPISEHIEEMRQRSLQVLCFAFLAIGVMFLKITPIVELLEAPIEGIKFIQLSPGEYFLSTVKISFYGEHNPKQIERRNSKLRSGNRFEPFLKSKSRHAKRCIFVESFFK